MRNSRDVEIVESRRLALLTAVLASEAQAAAAVNIAQGDAGAVREAAAAEAEQMLAMAKAKAAATEAVAEAQLTVEVEKSTPDADETADGTGLVGELLLLVDEAQPRVVHGLVHVLHVLLLVLDLGYQNVSIFLNRQRKDIKLDQIHLNLVA